MHSYVALCCTAEHAMLWMLEQNPRLQTILICTDHDEAGIEAVGRLTEILRNEDYHQAAPFLSQYKDWDEDLKAVHGRPAEPAEEHPQLIAAVPICQRIGELCGGQTAENLERKLPGLLQEYKNHLRLGRPDQAMKRMEQAAALPSRHLSSRSGIWARSFQPRRWRTPCGAGFCRIKLRARSKTVTSSLKHSFKGCWYWQTGTASGRKLRKRSLERRGWIFR